MKRKYYNYWSVTTYNSDYMFTDDGKLVLYTTNVNRGTNFGCRTKKQAIKLCRYIRTIDKNCEIVVVQYIWKKNKRYNMDWKFTEV